MIEIRKSKTADSRTCDHSKVSLKELSDSTIQHIIDVEKGLNYFIELLETAMIHHDHDKISNLDDFHAEFVNGFKETTWLHNHYIINRHHLKEPEGVPADVNLIDVLEYITDCVMAGMGRSGTVYDITIPPELLTKAFNNTVALLKSNVKVV